MEVHRSSAGEDRDASKDDGTAYVNGPILHWKRTWKETISIVSPNKGTLFGSLEEYLDFRVVDAGTS